jgi:transposase-like protein
MNPQEQVCPFPSCGASGKEGAIRVHSRQEGRYRCARCGHTFSERRATALEHLKKPPALFLLVVKLLAYGCPIQAIVFAFELDERTVRRWLLKAGAHCQRVHEGQLPCGGLELGQIQVDELKVNTWLGVLWLGMVMQVCSRLWLGGAVGPSRNKVLLGQVFGWAQRVGKPGRLLVAVDGLNIYLQVIPAVFQSHWDWLKGRAAGWSEVAIVQTMKQMGNRRGNIDRILVQGGERLVRELVYASQGHGWINTAYIERLNATFRQRLSCLARRSRQMTRQTDTLEAWMWLQGSVYNWCTFHQALATPLPLSTGKRRWLKRTPAIAAQLTDHQWTIEELMTWKRPIPSPHSHYILSSIP